MFSFWSGSTLCSEGKDHSKAGTGKDCADHGPGVETAWVHARALKKFISIDMKRLDLAFNNFL